MVTTEAKNSKHFSEGIKSQVTTLQQLKTMNNYFWSECYIGKIEVAKQSQKIDLEVL